MAEIKIKKCKSKFDDNYLFTKLLIYIFFRKGNI